MPASPLLLLVPYRYKAAVLYSQIPISASASGDFVVSRAGDTASRILGNGNIETGVLANIARINYPRTGVASGCAGLLVEPVATNLTLQSQTFDVSGTWTFVTGGTGSLPSVTANAVISPDGTQNAETVLLNRGANNTSSDQSTLQQTITLATNGTYTFSVYAKATSSADVGKQIFLRAGSAGGLIPFTLTANWVRLTTTEIALSSGSNVLQIGNRGGFTNANSISVDLWGAQMEFGSIATSYITTVASSVTRNADVITNNQFVIPNLIGAILTEFESPTSGTYFVDNLPVTLVSGYNKVAISYTPTTITVYRNGTQVSGSPFSPPGGVLPILGNVINIGHNNQYYQLGANIRSFVLYSSTLTAAEASGLTT